MTVASSGGGGFEEVSFRLQWCLGELVWRLVDEEVGVGAPQPTPTCFFILFWVGPWPMGVTWDGNDDVEWLA